MWLAPSPTCDGYFFLLYCKVNKIVHQRSEMCICALRQILHNLWAANAFIDFQILHFVDIKRNINYWDKVKTSSVIYSWFAAHMHQPWNWITCPWIGMWYTMCNKYWAKVTKKWPHWELNPRHLIKYRPDVTGNVWWALLFTRLLQLI